MKKADQFEEEMELRERQFNKTLEDMTIRQKMAEQQLEISQHLMDLRDSELRLETEATHADKLTLLRAMRDDIDKRILPVIGAYKSSLIRVISHVDSIKEKYYLKDLNYYQQELMMDEMDEFFSFGIKNLGVHTQVKSKEGYLASIAYLISEDVFKIDQVYSKDLAFLRDLDFYDLLKDRYDILVGLLSFTDEFGKNLAKNQISAENVESLFKRRIMTNPRSAKHDFDVEIKNENYYSNLLIKVKTRFERIERRCIEVRGAALKAEEDIFNNALAEPNQITL